ncbi:MAG TPA: GAF domain-containing protein [Euryarchaeota archaeon]|nr:GAF domain-containing protein [Euryarchaeota archaeon]
MQNEFALSVVAGFSAGTMVLLIMIAREKKQKFPWLSFALMFGMIFFAALYMIIDKDMETTVMNDFYIFIPFIWIVSVFLLSRANYEDKIEKQYAEISALNEVARSYLGTGDMSKAAKIALDRFANAFNADGGLIFTIGAEDKRVEIVSTFGELPTHALQLLRSTAFKVAKDGKVVHRMTGLDNDLKDLHKRYIESSRREGFKSVAGFPIRSQAHFFGMFILFSRRPLRLTQQDRAILALASLELGMWFEQIAGVKAIQRMSDIKKGLLDSSLALRMDFSPEEVMQAIIEQLEKLIPVRDLVIYLYNPATEKLWPAYSVGEYAHKIMAEGEFSVEKAGIAGEVLRSGVAEIVEDVFKDPRAAKVPEIPENPTSMLSVPLISRGKKIGLIELHRKHPDRFNEEEMETATLFAQHASVAIENAWLIRDMEQEKSRSQLYLDLLSHDVANLNTPLSSYLDMLRSDCELEDRPVSIVCKASEIVEKMSALLMRVRRLSNIDTREEQELVKIDLMKLIEESVQSLRKAFPGRELDIGVRSSMESNEVLAGEMLDEILFNLLHNAVKFSTEKKARIEIDLGVAERDDGKFCKLMIADYGKGVPEEEKEAIFQEKATPAASFARGFGIGLCICRKLLERYGGDIWVEDREEGDFSQGAKFTVLLPFEK